MSTEPILPPLGNEVIDSLRDLQLRADTILNPASKTAYILEQMDYISSDELFNQAFKVEAFTVIGTLPTIEGLRRFIFTEGMKFIGRAATYAYFLKPSETMDYLTVGFEEPIVIDPEEAAADFALFTFQVPVLAIDSFEEAA